MLVLLALLLGIVLSEDCNHFYDVPLDECAYSTVYSYDWDTTSYSEEYSYGYYCNYNETEDEYFVDYVYYDVEDCNGELVMVKYGIQFLMIKIGIVIVKDQQMIVIL